jgi:type III restriction enzyme
MCPSDSNSRRKEFQYEVQPYQEDCIANIVDIFRQIENNAPFDEIITLHTSRHQLPPTASKKKNIDIMMETGTGKTFTYIKTIFELNKIGYKKFILLVPTIAIREGSAAGFEDTKTYFKQIYASSKEREIALYVYESGKTEIIDQFFFNPDELSCLILTPASFNAKDNILNRPLERDYVRAANSYLELLKSLDPVVIMDEPHKFKGEKFNEYFQGFNNYFLRFGATFPLPDKKGETIPLSNTAYILDGITAFRKNLVKQITVHTQDIIKAEQMIGSINAAQKQVRVNNYVNGKFSHHSDLTVGQKFNGTLIRKINKSSIVLANDKIIRPEFTLTEDAMRTMIADAIALHLEKEAELFNNGVKALTLFFIEHIEHYRSENNPIVKKIFEEEYVKLRKKKIQSLKGKQEFANYLLYLENDFDSDGVLQVHQGYFSGDKGNTDEKIQQGVDEILRDKRKLLSIESPTRFVFSVWALQEGWDNPNVFTLCKLSDHGSETSKLQQIGRGLRICVDQDLQRQTITQFNDNQEAFWNVNNLDVIVTNHDAHFAEAIQKEILSKSFLLDETFTKQNLIGCLREKNHFDDNVLRHIVGLLESEKLITFQKFDENGNEVYARLADYNNRWQKLLESPDRLPAPLTLEHLNAVQNIFALDVKTFVKNAVKAKKKRIRIKDEHYEEFRSLWETINRNSLYFIDDLTESNETQLIETIAGDINQLDIKKNFLQRKKTVIEADKLQETLTTESTDASEYKGKVDYIQLAQNIARNTKTPLTFAIKIINAISPNFKKTMLPHDPAAAQSEMEGIITKHLLGNIRAKMNYTGIDGDILCDGIMYDSNGNFRKELPAGSLGKTQENITANFSLKEEWIFEDIIEYDSDFEREIILQDPKRTEIKIFGKMPKLEINTPLGKYSPDFCYALEGNNGKKVILVVESKGYEREQDIPHGEKTKIDFAEKFFCKINEKFEKEGIRVVYQKRINRDELVTLIKNAIA